MRHPSEYWIKFLLSRRGHSFEEIQGICELSGLGAVETDYLQIVNAELKSSMPKPFRPKDRAHRDSQKFLRSQRIQTAWFKTKDMVNAESILNKPEVKALLEVFILSPLKPEQTIKKINKKTGENLTEGAYKLYRHYFWNPSLLNGAEWGIYLRNRRDAHAEWARCALNVHDPQGVQMIMWKTGTGALKNLESGKMFTDIRNIAYIRIKETEHWEPSMQNSQMFLNYARAAKMAQEEVSNSSEALQDMVQAFQAFKMRQTEREIPTIQQLTSGNCVVDEVSKEDDGLEY